jgi:steroid delta-isomerase-like uncharacterized protein
MSTEENKELVRRYQEAYNTNNMDVLDEILAPDLISHSLMPGLPPGRESLRQLQQLTLAAFPDFHTTIEDLIAEGDKVVARCTTRGTHKGEFLGTPPSGKPFTFTWISIFRIADGKIVEHWGEEDALGWLQQLGAIPPMG